MAEFCAQEMAFGFAGYLGDLLEPVVVQNNFVGHSPLTEIGVSLVREIALAANVDPYEQDEDRALFEDPFKKN